MTSKETLAKVVVKSRLHASKNPIAQFRKETTVDAVLGDPVICDPLTRSMCCLVGDASAAAVLVSGEMLNKIKGMKADSIKVLGCVAQSGGYASATGLTYDPSEKLQELLKWPMSRQA